MTAPGLLLPEPFVSVATFKAHPTYLDFNNLRSGDAVGADQDAALYDILVEASSWAENICQIPLHAHVATDFTRGRVDRHGFLKFHLGEPPVRQVLSLGWGVSPGSYATVNNPVCQIEDGANVITSIAGANTSWTGALQIGVPMPGCELFLKPTYVGGFVSTVLSSPATATQSTITVADPIGIYPGDMLRLWDPGQKEVVIVGPAFVPVPTFPYAPTAVPLVSPLAFNHAAGTTVSAMPANLILAFVHLGIDLLQRQPVAPMGFPGTSQQPQSGTGAPSPTSVHELKALQILATYTGVR